MLPDVLLPRVLAALHEAGDAHPIQTMEPVRGGYVSHALRLGTGRARYFLKWNASRTQGRFTVEARGLALLRDTGTVAVPRILAAADATDELPGYLLQEWLTPPPREVFLRRVGAGLGGRVAALHAAGAVDGTPLPGYCMHPLPGDGRPPLWEADWAACYRDQVLRPQIERAGGRGYLTPERRRGLERLLERLDALLAGMERRPSLQHGDLWKNNVLCNRAGDLVLIDAHPCYGDRELEFAYTEWCGGFSPLFYAAYNEVWPLPPGRAERRDLYLLCYMLRNLNSGDARSAQAIDAVVRWYAGS